MPTLTALADILRTQADAATDAADVRRQAAVPRSSPDKLITAARAAQLLKITPRQVRRRAGDFDGVKINGKWELDGLLVYAEVARRTRE